MNTRIILLLLVLLPVYCFGQSEEDIIDYLNDYKGRLSNINTNISDANVSSKTLNSYMEELDDIAANLADYDMSVTNPTLREKILIQQLRVGDLLPKVKNKIHSNNIKKASSITKTERIVGGSLFVGALAYGGKLYLDSRSSYESYENAIYTNDALNYYDSAEKYLQQSLIVFGSGVIVSGIITFIVPLITESVMKVKESRRELKSDQESIAVD